MTKRFAVDYWVDPDDEDDPDRTDYAHTREELDRTAEGERHRDGQLFGCIILYERLSREPNEMRRWRELRRIR
jgi:hypothetical protein